MQPTDAAKILSFVRSDLEPQRNGPHPDKQRCISLAITRLEEAEMWLRNAQSKESGR